jgi:uncharacterized protein
MAKTPSGFRAALLVGWVVLGAAGIIYARAKAIPGWAAMPVLVAFLFEYPFYLVTGFATLRERLSGVKLPAVLVMLTVVPYLICCLGPVTFGWSGFVRLAAVALAVSLWYPALPASRLTDGGFLALVVWISLGRYFDPIYHSPFRLYPAELGRLSLFLCAALSLMLERRIPETGYGFIPSRNEWRIGLLHYVYFLAVGIPVALLLKTIHVTHMAPLWLIAATFVGYLWGIGLAEEFLFRGVLQQWIEDWTWSQPAALILTSVVFGGAHLWFANSFPNWKMALVASIHGWFCGRARNRAGSIRASIVTHTLVVTSWRAFFAIG